MKFIADNFSDRGDEQLEKTGNFLTDIITLSKLAVEGKFVSSDLNLPSDSARYDWKFFINDKEFERVKEAYAPGNDYDGYVIFYVLDEETSSLKLEMETGKVKIIKELAKEPFSRNKQYGLSE